MGWGKMWGFGFGIATVAATHNALRDFAMTGFFG
jgi:hypothetical protein